MPRKAKYKRKSTQGSISHSPERKEKSWRARITLNGERIHIGWFETEQQADEAIIEYLNDPARLPSNKTFKQVYNAWYQKQLEKEVKRHSRKEGHPVSPADIENNSSFTTYKAAYKSFNAFYNKKFAMITKKMVELEMSRKNPPMQKKLRVLIRFLSEYALDEEIIDGTRYYELQNVKTEPCEKS